ncbi:MAG: UPF0280 family protein [Spirochaetales bacterium]|nr:UPF0280 family protein [Spirochaetales bacterium]
MKRNIREFHHKDAHFHIMSGAFDRTAECIRRERLNLELFLKEHPGFQEALEPFELNSDVLPESVRRMQEASRLTGIGPMAAVAGTMAALAAEASAGAGSEETIIENGGDLYLDCREEVVLGLYTGSNMKFRNLALRVTPSMMPVAVCSSSSRMGHSLSFGDCDLVTVFSKDASLADAAATMGCNSVRDTGDIENVLNRLSEIEGILGVLIIRDGHFGAVGAVPELVRTKDPDLQGKISRDDLAILPPEIIK